MKHKIACHAMLRQDAWCKAVLVCIVCLQFSGKRFGDDVQIEEVDYGLMVTPTFSPDPTESLCEVRLDLLGIVWSTKMSPTKGSFNFRCVGQNKTLVHVSL